MRLIDADALREFVEGRYTITWDHDYDGGIKDACIDILNFIDTAPTIDAEPVVRCKDCFLYGECKAAEWYGENGNGYCSIGNRRKDDE